MNENAVGLTKRDSATGARAQPLTLAPACQTAVVSKVRGCMPALPQKPFLVNPKTCYITANCSSVAFEPTRVLYTQS